MQDKGISFVEKVGFPSLGQRTPQLPLASKGLAIH